MARSKGTSSRMWPETLTSGPVASLFSRQCLQWTSSRKQEQIGKTGKSSNGKLGFLKILLLCLFVFFSKYKSKAKSLCEVQTGLNIKDKSPDCPVIL